MEIIYLLIPLSIIIVGLIVTVFIWSVKNGQFDDLEGPGGRILFEDENKCAPPLSSDEPKDT